MEFQRGDDVEIVSREQGLVGSYYAATVISQISKDEYIVQYRTLLMEDESRPLREIVVAGDVRPAPPRIPETLFRQRDSVDAFDKDGWWVGLITRRKGSKYYVFFEATGERIAYPLDRLRGHLDWLNGKWVSPNKKEK